MRRLLATPNNSLLASSRESIKKCVAATSSLADRNH